MNTNTMSPYLMRKSGNRSVRRISRIDTPQATNMSNYDNANIMEDNVLESKRMLDGDDQGGYFHDSNRAEMAVAFNNNANMIRSGRQGNAYVIGYNTPQRAKLERRR
tara:strand:- start:2992 stop:3312 length:321 start_codon:yes stop_codon:yes gene_type:complete